jgi:cell division transport system permease protein
MARVDGDERGSLLRRLAQEHARVFFFSLGKLAKNPVGSLLTALVIGVTLALPAGLHVLTENLSGISYSWEGALQISLFLKDEVRADRGRALAREIGKRPGVARTQFISREQSLREFRELSGFGEALDILQENPLPAVIAVLPDRTRTRPQVDEMLAELAKLPEVDLAKMDQKWLERLYAILAIVERAVLIFASLLGLAVVVIVGNTIRLDIESRREEIVVMKLIGAPDGFIRRPFLYAGFWHGLAGAALGCILVSVALAALAGPSRELTELYAGGMKLTGLTLGTVAIMLGAGIALGWFGAYWTVSRHLSHIEPQ